MAVPGRIVLAVLRADARGNAVGAAEDDRRVHLAARHVELLGGRVDDLVDRLHGEIPGHEFDDRAQAGEGGADADAGKAMLGDGRVDDALRPDFLQEVLRDLVGALVLGDLLAHDEDVAIAAHFLGHRLVQRLPDGHLDHLDTRRQIRVGGGLEFRCSNGGGRGCLGFDRRRCFGGGSGLRHGSGGLGSRLTGGLAFAEDQRDRGVDLHALGAFGNEDRLDLAGVDALDFHGRLVGLDLGQDVAGLDHVADLDQPFGELPLLHGRRQRGHQNIGHVALLIRRRRRCWSTVPTALVRHRRWRNRRPR